VAQARSCVRGLAAFSMSCCRPTHADRALLGMPPGGADILFKFIPPETAGAAGWPPQVRRRVERPPSPRSVRCSRAAQDPSRCSGGSSVQAMTARYLTRKRALLTLRSRHVVRGLVAILLARRLAGRGQEKSRDWTSCPIVASIVVTLTTVPPFAFQRRQGPTRRFRHRTLPGSCTRCSRTDKVEFVSVSAEGAGRPSRRGADRE